MHPNCVHNNVDMTAHVLFRSLSLHASRCRSPPPPPNHATHPHTRLAAPRETNTGRASVCVCVLTVHTRRVQTAPRFLHQSHGKLFQFDSNGTAKWPGGAIRRPNGNAQWNTIGRGGEGWFAWALMHAAYTGKLQLFHLGTIKRKPISIMLMMSSLSVRGL